MVLLFACGPKQNMVYMEKNGYEQEISQAAFQGTRIQTGDILDIKVSAFDEFAVRPFNQATMYRSNDLNSSGNINNANNPTAPEGYLVDTEGYINFPVLGRLHVAGELRQDLESDLEQRLKKYLTDPMVSVRRLNFTVTVLGEVNRPGQYNSPTDKVNLFQALGLAGDMTMNGDRTNVRLIRNENGVERTYTLDFNDASITKSPVYYLQQNDIIYVQPDQNKKIAANNNPNRTLTFTVIGVAVTLTTLLINVFR